MIRAGWLRGDIPSRIWEICARRALPCGRRPPMGAEGPPAREASVPAPQGPRRRAAKRLELLVFNNCGLYDQILYHYSVLFKFYMESTRSYLNFSLVLSSCYIKSICSHLNLTHRSYTIYAIFVSLLFKIAIPL